MRLRRFKVDHLSEAGIRVSGTDAVHALRVLRLGIGSAVVVFDGAGREMEGTILSIGDMEFDVQPTGPIREAGDDERPLVLAVAPPKGERADWLVEKCAELGVREVHWTMYSRATVVPGSGKMTRWNRKAAEAAKQSGQSRVMRIGGPSLLETLIRESNGERTVLLADPSTQSPTLIDWYASAACNSESRIETWVFIGPEGGLTDDERSLILDAGGTSVRLGDAILRIETAAICAAAAWAGLTADPRQPAT